MFKIVSFVLSILEKEPLKQQNPLNSKLRGFLYISP
jgi:hypothetical protein